MRTYQSIGRIWIVWQWEYLQALRAGRPVQLLPDSLFNPQAKLFT